MRTLVTSGSTPVDRGEYNDYSGAGELLAEQSVLASETTSYRICKTGTHYIGVSMRKSTPSLTVPFKRDHYEALSKRMDRYPLKLQRAREKYLRYLDEGVDLVMTSEFTDLDKHVIKLNQKEQS